MLLDLNRHLRVPPPAGGSGTIRPDGDITLDDVRTRLINAGI